MSEVELVGGPRDAPFSGDLLEVEQVMVIEPVHPMMVRREHSSRTRNLPIYGRICEDYSVSVKQGETGSHELNPARNSETSPWGRCGFNKS